MTPYGKVTKTEENITHIRAKRLTHCQQVTARLKGTDSMTDLKHIDKRSTALEWSVKNIYWRAQTN